MKYNRKQYMNKEVSHDEYYGQFVDSSLMNTVASFIGEDKIKRSTDPHFNEIPLKSWDNLNEVIRLHCGRSIADSNKSTGGGGISLSDTVCVAKAAARQIREDSDNGQS